MSIIISCITFCGSFWQGTVRPYIIHSDRSSSPINILFICEETRSCRPLRFWIQYPWTPSLPGAFQFGIFLHSFLIFLTLMLALSWGCLLFTLSFSFQIFQLFCVSVMLFSDTPDIPAKLYAFFCIWHIIQSNPIPV